MEQILVAFDDSTSNQICVVTVPDLGDYEIVEYAIELGRRWGVGTSKDNGIIIVVKPKNESGGGDATIQVGYGLEGAITDGSCGTIIRHEMIPAFKEEDYYTGIYNACDQLMKLASGEISEPRDDDPSGFAILFGFVIPMLVLFIVLVIIAKKKGGGNFTGGSGSSSSGRPFIWFGPGSGGHSSGGWGGGSSHGGFGGFGGGSFGGGGASGHW